MIRVKNLTKDYGKNKGIFDISFEVQDGEVLGCLGPKGAGKTTVIRQLLGFERPSAGRCFISGKGCYVKRNELHRVIGYAPEREALPGHETGLSFLRLMAAMRDLLSIERAVELAEYFEVDLNVSIYKLSEEARQCLSIISALMHKPSTILLDDPMNSLGKQQKYRVDKLIQNEKASGKTILITSTKFEEIEHICDRIIMLKEGGLVKTDDIAGIREVKKMAYIITFADEAEARRFVKEKYTEADHVGRQVTIKMTGEMTMLVRQLGDYQVVGVEVAHQSLEEVFEYYYGGQNHA